MVELFLLLVFALLIVAGGYFYYQSVAKKPFQRGETTPFETGLLLLLDGEWNGAAKQFVKAAKEDPDNVHARIRLGDVLRLQGEVERALRLHLELSNRDQLSTGERIAIAKALAEDFEEAQLPEKALSQIDQILSFDKNHGWALQKRLKHLANKGDWTGYIESSKRLASLRGEPLNSRRMAIVCALDGDRLCAAGKEKDGRLRYREASKYDTTFPGGYLGLAESYRREKRVDDALKEIHELSINAPKFAHLGFPLVEALLFEQGRFDEIESFYHEFIRSNAHGIEGYLALATIAERKGEVNQSLQILREGLEANPWSEALQYQLARGLTKSNRVDELAKLGLEVMRRLAPPSNNNVCKNCGHTTETMRWFCPSCGVWESFA